MRQTFRHLPASWPTFSAVCLLAGAALCHVAYADESGCRLGHVADLPLVSKSGIFITTVQVNDKPLNLQLDTGASISLVSEDTATRLAMRVYRQDERREQFLSRVEGVGGSRAAVQVIADNVTLGSAHGKSLPFTAAAGLTFAAGTDGILGMDLLHYYDIDIDVPGHQLHLFRALTDCSSPAVALHGDLYALKLENIGWTISPVAIVQINGVQLKAILDTGAFQSTMFRPAAVKLGIAGDVPLKGGVGGLGTETVAARVQRNVTIDLGDIAMTNVPLVIAGQGKLGQADVLLGYDFFTRVHVWISHSSRTLIVQYPPRPSPVVP